MAKERLSKLQKSKKKGGEIDNEKEDKLQRTNPNSQ